MPWDLTYNSWVCDRKALFPKLKQLCMDTYSHTCTGEGYPTLWAKLGKVACCAVFYKSTDVEPWFWIRGDFLPPGVRWQHIWRHLLVLQLGKVVLLVSNEWRPGMLLQGLTTEDYPAQNVRSVNQVWEILCRRTLGHMREQSLDLWRCDTTTSS